MNWRLLRILLNNSNKLSPDQINSLSIGNESLILVCSCFTFQYLSTFDEQTKLFTVTYFKLIMLQTENNKKKKKKLVCFKHNFFNFCLFDYEKALNEIRLDQVISRSLEIISLRNVVRPRPLHYLTDCLESRKLLHA